MKSWPPGWWDDAACRGVGTDIFFDTANTAEAMAYCARCEVTAECAEAGANASDGVWAGVRIRRHSISVGLSRWDFPMSPAERQRQSRARRKVAS